MIGRIIDSYRRWRRRGQLRGRRGPNFARGDHAVCIAEGDWIVFETGALNPNGPVCGEEYVVVDIGMKYDSHLIQVTGWPGSWFTADSFRKLIQDKCEAHNECPALLDLVKKREDA